MGGIHIMDNQNYFTGFSSLKHQTFDSSVGRAVDCSCYWSEIHRSLVQIRLEGVFVFDQRHLCWQALSLMLSLKEARVAQSVER